MEVVYMLRRLRILLAFSVLVFVFNGCDYRLVDNSHKSSRNSEYTIVRSEDVDKEAEDVSKRIYELIVSKDENKLKQVFAPYTIKCTDIENEIKSFFSQIEGNVISYKKIETVSRDRHMGNKGDVANFYCESIVDIKTDAGISYCISVDGTYNYLGSEDMVGVNDIFLCYSDEYSYEKKISEIGEAIEYTGD